MKKNRSNFPRRAMLFSEGKENVKCNLTIYIYIYKYIIYIVSSGMRKRKVFRETVITVIVIAL